MRSDRQCRFGALRPPSKKMVSVIRNARSRRVTNDKKQGRPDYTGRPRSAALLARSFSPLPVPTGGSDFPPEPSAALGSDEFEAFICFCRPHCNWKETPSNAFSKAVAPLQQRLPASLATPKNRQCKYCYKSAAHDPVAI